MRDKIWSKAKSLSSFGLETGVEEQFVGVNDRTDVRIFLVCETCALEELKEAILCCLEAEKLWRQEGRDSLALNLRILLFGTAMGDPIVRVRTIAKELSPVGSALPITLYLSDANGPIVVSARHLLDAVEITIALLLLGDQSSDGAFEKMWRQSNGTVFTVALREHWNDGLERCVKSVIAKAIKRRFDTFLGGEPASRLQLQSIIDDLVRKEHADLLTASVSSEPWLRDIYACAPAARYSGTFR